MKKTVFALIAIAALGLVSCQKTGTTDPELTPAEKVEGIYSGNMVISLGDNPSEPLAQDIKVSANGDAAIDLEISNFSFSGIELGTIALEDCPLTENAENGSIIVSADKTVELDIVGKCEISLAGSFAGETAKLELEIVPGSFPLKVGVTFEGDKNASATE